MQTSDKLFAQNWIEQYRDNMANVRLTEAARYRDYQTASGACACFGNDWDCVVRYSFIWAYAPQIAGLWSDRCASEPSWHEALIR